MLSNHPLFFLFAFFPLKYRIFIYLLFFSIFLFWPFHWKRKFSFYFYFYFFLSNERLSYRYHNIKYKILIFKLYLSVAVFKIKYIYTLLMLVYITGYWGQSTLLCKIGIAGSGGEDLMMKYSYWTTGQTYFKPGSRVGLDGGGPWLGWGRRELGPNV